MRKYLLVGDAYASTLQGSMSQDQYDGLQLAACLSSVDISGSCMGSNNLCINLWVIHF